jgi:hypothetical protein
MGVAYSVAIIGSNHGESVRRARAAFFKYDVNSFCMRGSL